MNIHIQIEPVGSVAPRINSGDKFEMVFQEKDTTFSLFCPAQSYPVPAFR